MTGAGYTRCNSWFFKGESNEAYISTLGDQTEADSWLPRQNENPRWTVRDPGAESQGTGKTERLDGDAINSFPRSHRLLKPAEFSSVFNFRCAVVGKYFQIQFRPNGKEHSRLGMIVAKKSERLAVHRNFTKRVIRELFRTHHCDIIGLDIVVRLRKPFREEMAIQARQELRELIGKVAHVAASGGTD